MLFYKGLIIDNTIDNAYSKFFNTKEKELDALIEKWWRLEGAHGKYKDKEDVYLSYLLMYYVTMIYLNIEKYTIDDLVVKFKILEIKECLRCKGINLQTYFDYYNITLKDFELQGIEATYQIDKEEYIEIVQESVIDLLAKKNYEENLVDSTIIEEIFVFSINEQGTLLTV